jgi:YegS/Rv2252/BmrU family lipid kinase
VCAEPGDLGRVLAGLGGRTLVVVGGDGSVHTAVATLLSRGQLSGDRPIGLVPLGTGNDLARTLELPLDPAAAARALLTGRPRPLDLVVDDAGGVVVNAVHLGVGAEAAEKATALKDRLGRAAYTVGSLAAGAGATGWHLQVVVDGVLVDVDREVLMVAVANGRTIGGGAPLAPDASPDDGLVDVVVATSTGPLARLGFARALRDGEHVERDDVLVVRGRTVTVTGDPFPLNADGELDGPVSARTWTVRPAAWSLVVPRLTGVRPTSSGGSA